MTDPDPLYRELMRHPVARPTRRKVRRPWSLTPPRCDSCGKQRAPGVDHTECSKEQP